MIVLGWLGVVFLALGVGCCAVVWLAPEHGRGTTGSFGVFACSIFGVVFSVLGALFIPMGFSKSSGLGVIRGASLVALVVQVIAVVYGDAMSRKKVWRLVLISVIAAALLAV
jgi:hypothetical protein